MCIPTGELPIEVVLQKDVPPNSGAKIIDKAEISDVQYAFFNALEMPEDQVILNMDKAAEITKARLRLAREPLLAALDIQFQRAIEIGADTTAIVQEKQRLRDLPDLVYTCTTPEELRALHP